MYCDPAPEQVLAELIVAAVGRPVRLDDVLHEQRELQRQLADAKNIIEGGNFQVTVTLGMYLGPHNNGQKTSVCKALLDQYPNGADVPVAINDDNGNLVGFWIWHLDTANSDCQGQDGEQLAGWFVNDITSTLPLDDRCGRLCIDIRPIRCAAGRVAPSVSIAERA